MVYTNVARIVIWWNIIAPSDARMKMREASVMDVEVRLPPETFTETYNRMDRIIAALEKLVGIKEAELELAKTAVKNLGGK